MPIQISIQHSLTPNTCKSFAFRIIAVLLVFVTGIRASSPLDGYTPSSLTPGSPAGVYPLSDFENINLFNGNLNFNLHLGQIVGRGAAQWPIYFNLETTHWVVDVTAEPYNCTPTEICYNYYYYPNPYAWTGTNGPSDLYARQVAVKNDPGCQGGNDTANTRLTFRLPDGTEFELVDQITGGVQQTRFYAGCSPYSQSPYNRGSIFVTTDGSAATFVSDSDIVDSYGSARIFYPSGFLSLRNGARYRIDNGWISWLRDQNGNKLTFIRNQSTPGKIISITDSLNRQVTYSDSSDTGLGYNEITFRGFGGASRTIKLHYGNYLDENVMLRRDYRSSQGGSGFQTYQQLFPGLNGSYSGIYHFSRVTSIELPDNRLYRLYYSPYGNLARVELPTGGATEYDIAVSAPGNEILTQRITERRTFLNSNVGAPIYNRTTYTNGVRTYDGNSVPLSAENHYFHGSPSIQFHPFAYTPWNEGKEYQTELLTADGSTMLRKINHTWEQGCGPGGMSTHPRANNPRVTQTTATLVDTNQVSKQTFTYDCYNNRTDVYEYDYGPGAPSAQATRHTHTDYLTTNPANGVNYATNNNIHLRSLPQRQINYAVTPSTGVETWLAQTEYEYDRYDTSSYHALLVNRTNISGPIVNTGLTDPCAGSATCPSGYTTRGNATQTNRWLNSGGSSVVSTYAQYDIAGNVVKTIDAGRYDAANNLVRSETNFDYADRFGSPNGEAQSNTPPTNPNWLNGQVTFAFPTKVTNALGHIAYTQFDYYLGKPIDSEDPNGVKSSFYYNDLLDRPTQVRNHVTSSTAYYRQTTFAYDDDGMDPPNGDTEDRTITVRSDLNNKDDNLLVSKSSYDGLGRTWRAASVHGSGQWSIADTQFDALGRTWRVSNPYLAANINGAVNPSGVWTTTQYDALSRVLSVQTPDAATVTTAYNGARVLVTDQANKQRLSESDALGRLLNVWEIKAADAATVAVSFPNYPGVTAGYLTNYRYDALDNLIIVAQGGTIGADGLVTGGQGRYFKYDSLSRLIRAKNPEQDVNGSLTLGNAGSENTQWSMAYSYDPNGNLQTRTDARGIVVTYTYDALNRSKTVNYSNTTSVANAPDITRNYDNPASGAYGIGRFWHDYAGDNPTGGTIVEHQSVDSYDALGRPLLLRREFKYNPNANGWSNPFNTAQTYDLAGNVKTVSYPSGRSVVYRYDTAGRLDKFTGNLGLGGQQQDYARDISYTAAGQMALETFGTTQPLIHRMNYNNRQQLYNIRLGTGTGLDGAENRGRLTFYYGTNHASNGDDGAHNNGNVYRADHVVPLDDNISDSVASICYYGYDELNRLTAVDELPIAKRVGNNAIGWLPQAYAQRYKYDRWGNRTLNTVATWGIGINRKAFDASTINNRLSVTAGQAGTLTYDPAGNLTFDNYSHPGTQSNSYTYDAENRQTLAQVSVNNGAAVNYSYTYDADGKRMRRRAGAAETWQVYGLGGELLAEYGWNGTTATLQKEYGYRSGQLLIVAQHSPFELRWQVADQLGTPRMSVRGTGADGGSLASIARHDYLPFGEELIAGMGVRSTTNGYVGDNVRQKYGSKERDTETGLDYFGARYYSSAQGRLTGADPGNAGSIFGDPQSWNGYAYARNHPLLYSDPDGQRYLICGPNGCGTISDEEFANERDRFRAPGNRLTFTGDSRSFYGGGDIRSEQGEYLASYQQISIDDSALELGYEVRQKFKDPATYKRAALNVLIGAVIARAVSPALKGSPYHPDVRDARVRPPYRANQAHNRGSSSYNPRKTPEPPDAADVYQTSVRGGMGSWYGKNANGEIYQFFSDNAGGVHFAGKIAVDKLRQKNADVARELGF